jgi:invasion protein IalB
MMKSFKERNVAMRLDTGLCAQRVLAGTLLALLMTNTGLAQEKQTQPAEPAPPAQGGQTQPNQVQSGPPPVWVVSCDNNQGRLDCRAGQTVFIKPTGQRLLSVAVRVPADTKKPVLLLQVPLGVYLPAGASLEIGKAGAKTLPFRGCDQAGCLAQYAITDEEIASMAKGADLTISVQNQNRKPAFTVTVPVTGFAAAYAKVK